MSSNNSPTLVLELRRPWLRVLPVVVLLLTALIMPWLASTAPFWSRVLGVILGIGLAVWASRTDIRTVVVSWGQDQQWRMQVGRAETGNVVLSSRSWLSPWLMCLKFTTETGVRRQVMCWRGELSAAAWQQWQLRLRLEAGRQVERRVNGIAA